MDADSISATEGRPNHLATVTISSRLAQRWSVYRDQSAGKMERLGQRLAQRHSGKSSELGLDGWWMGEADSVLSHVYAANRCLRIPAKVYIGKLMVQNAFVWERNI